MKLPEFFARSPLTRGLWVFRQEFLVVGIFSMVANLLMLTPTLYMLQIYDRAMMSQNQMTLLAVSLVALFFFVAMAFSEWMRARVMIRAGVRFDEMLNVRVFNAGFESSLNRAEPNPAEAFSDLRNIRQFITGNAIYACFDLPWAPIYIIVAWLLHPWIGLLSLVFAVISALVAWGGHRLIHEDTESALSSQQKATFFVHEKLRNVEVIEALGMLDTLREHWRRLRHQSWREHDTAADRARRAQSVTKFVRYSQQSLMLAAGAILVIRGEMTPGGMIAANVLMARALQPLETVVGHWKNLLSTLVSFRRLDLLLERHPERPEGAAVDEIHGAIRLNNLVARAVGRDAPILQGLTCEFPVGKIILIIGPSGSGKSTLARCLLGIWPATEGEVWLDGIPVSQWERSQLGRRVGYLPQDVELLDGTIAENIARFDQVDSQQVIEAAQRAGVHEMVLRLPKGYDTEVGEAGNLLSAGQRQRIALARALYRDPPLLVLDEPNSNLDEAGESALIKVLRGLRARQRTVFLISHRFLVLDVIDWVVVLNEGRISRQGSRDSIFGPALTRPAPTGSTPAIRPQVG